MDENRFIPMPALEERNISIRHILDAGLPDARPAWRQLPLSALFFGVEDCLFLSALLAGLLLVPTVASVRYAPTGSLLAPLFLTSPALYALPHLLTLWKDTMGNTLEWKRTCRIPPGTLLALRMLVFGGTAVVMSVPAAVLYWAVSGRQISLLWLLGLSFSSLFLYAALSLSLPLLRRRAALFPPILWLLLGFILLRFLLAGAGLAWCLRTLQGMLNESKGVTRYAVR